MAALLFGNRRDFNGGDSLRFDTETFGRRRRDVDEPAALKVSATIHRDDDHTFVAPDAT